MSNMDAYDDLSLSGQINAAYGAQPPSRKRRHRDDDLFDVLDGGNDPNITQMQPSGLFFPGSFAVNPEGLGLSAPQDGMMLNSTEFTSQFLAGDHPANGLNRSGTMDVEVKDELGASGSLGLQTPVSIFTPSLNANVVHGNVMSPFSPSSTASSMPVTPSTVPSSPSTNPMAQVITINAPRDQQLIVPESPLPVPTHSAERFVAATRQKIEEVKIALEKLKWTQTELLLSQAPHPSESENLRSIHREVGQSLSQAQTMLTELRSQYILLPVEIHLLQGLQHEVDVLQKQLEVYDIELRYFNAQPNQ